MEVAKGQPSCRNYGVQRGLVRLYPLREALNKKAGKYGRLAVPHVIAINSVDVMLSDQDFEASLFGVRPGITIAGMTDELARGFWGTERVPTARVRGG